MRVIVFILLFSFSICSSISAQDGRLSLLSHQLFFEELTGFHFKEAKEILESKEKDIVEYHFLFSYFYWWQYLIAPSDHDLRKKLISHLDASIEKVESAETNALTQYIELTTYAFYARVLIYENDYLAAIQYVNKITSTIEYSIQKSEQSPYYKLTTGLYHFAAGYAKSEFWYLYPYFLFIPEGNEKKGIEELNDLVTIEDFLIQNEANYFLMKIYMEAYDDYQTALKYALKIVDNNPTNLLYQGLLYKIYCALNLNEEMAKQKELYYVKLKEIGGELSLKQYAFLENIENIQ